MKPLPFLLDSAPASDSAPGAAAPTAPSSTPATRNPRRPAVIVPVLHTDAELLALGCREAADSGLVDVIEWRVDPLVADTLDPAGGGVDAVAEAIRELAPHVTAAGLPVLATLRTAAEGGEAELSDAAYAEVVAGLAAALTDANAAAGASVPIAIDVEIARDSAQDVIGVLRTVGVPVVASRHNFADTERVADMRETLNEMRAAGAAVVKIAMMPTTAPDVADLLRATAEADADLDCPVLGISMGELGRTSRILGADFGSCSTFAQMGTASAPGQIAAGELAVILDRLYA